MTFPSKIDRQFIILKLAIYLILGVVCTLPLLIGQDSSWVVATVTLGVFVVVLCIDMLITIPITYTLNHDHMLIRGGVIKIRIDYQDIQHIQPTSDLYTGFRIMTSADALQIIYSSGLFGEIKISPQDKERFTQEVVSRAPHVRFVQS